MPGNCPASLRPTAARLWKTFRSKIGMLFGITTEWCPASERNRVHLRADSPIAHPKTATPLPTNVVVARSLSSALQSLALGGQSFLKFLVPHDRLTTLRTKTNSILLGSTTTLNNYRKSRQGVSQEVRCQRHKSKTARERRQFLSSTSRVRQSAVSSQYRRTNNWRRTDTHYHTEGRRLSQQSRARADQPA
jgi:hypothetical protein